MNSRNPVVILYVHKMDRATAFYREGLGLATGFESPGWTTFPCAGLTIALHLIEPHVDEGPVPHAGLNLEVDDLDAAVAQVTSAGGKLRALRPAGGGVPSRLAELTDTEGNGFELRQFVGEGPSHTGKVSQATI